MTLKKLSFLGLALVLIIAAGLFISRRAEPDAVRSHPLNSLSNDDVSRLTIKEPAGLVDLQKKDNDWVLTVPLADWAENSAVESLVSTLKGMAVGAVISEKKEKYANFELDDSRATHLQVFGKDPSKPVLDIFTGKQAVGYGSCYLRFSGQDPVYVAENLPSWMLTQPYDSYRKKSLFKSPVQNLTDLKIEADNLTFVLHKSSQTWSIEGSTSALDVSFEQSLVMKLEGLTIQGFLEPSEAAGVQFQKPFMKISAQSPQGETLINVGGKKVRKKGQSGSEQRYGQMAGRQSFFLLDSVAMEDFLKFLKAIKK